MEDDKTLEDETAEQTEDAQPTDAEEPAEPTTEAAEAADSEVAVAQAAEEPTEDDAATAEGTEAEAEPEVLDDTPPDDKILDPAKLRFFRDEDGTPRLEIEDDRTYLRIRVARLFPISLRRELIAISDGGDDEIGILRSLRELPKPMRRLVLEELRKRYFVPQITYVHSLKDEMGILYWDAETTRGRREIVVRDVRDHVREFGGGKLQITDVDGNVFEVANVDRLPGKGVSELYRLM